MRSVGELNTKKDITKRRRMLLFGMFGTALVVAILLLTLDIYRKSAVMDTLFSVYGDLAEQVTDNVGQVEQTTEPVAQIDPTVLNDLTLQVQELSNGTDDVDLAVGPAGSQGLAGVNGLNGTDGQDGIDGADGADGQDGANGQDGADGVDGIQGPQGIQGLQGLQGVQGIQGIQGPVGPAGADGTDGVATCPNGPCASLQAAPTVQESGYVYIDGIIADSFQGDGSGLTNLDPTALTGTISNARLSSSVTLQGNTFNGNSQLVQTTVGGGLPVISGANLTDLNASNLTSGTVSDARLSGNVTLQGNTFNGVSQLVQTNGSGALPVLSGANLTNLNASQITSGTMSDTRLSTNVTVQGNSFNSASQLVQLDGSGALPAVSGANLTNLPQTCPGCVGLQGSTPGTPQTGNLNISGTAIAGSFSGSGSGLTSLSANNLASGTVADARLSGGVTLQGNTFNGNSQLVQTTAGGALPVLSGANLTNLNASSLSSGTVADARLSGSVTLQGNSFNGVSQLVQSNGSGELPVISGANLTNLNASQISSGTLSNSRLASSVTVQGNTFNGVSQLVQLDGSGALPAVSGANLTDLPVGCGDCVDLQASTPGTPQTGHLNISGTAIAGSFTGSGAGLTSLNAGNVSSGTLSDSRLSANVTTQGNAFNGNSQLVQTTAGGVLPVISGANLTNLNAANVSTGTLNDARLSSNVTLQGNNFNAAGQLVQLNGSAQLPAVSGALLTNLNATNISSGTLSNSRLNSSVTLQSNTFNGASQLVQLDASGLLPVLNGSALTSLNANNIASGTLADARLTSNVALLNRDSQTFTGDNTVFRADNNSTTGFGVQNSGSTSVFNVDTANNETEMTNAVVSSGITVGASGTAITEMRLYTPTLDPANVPAASTSEQTFTVNGLSVNDTVIVNKPSLTSGCGMIGARVSAANTLAISWVNVLGILGCNPPSEVYRVMSFRSP